MKYLVNVSKKIFENLSVLEQDIRLVIQYQKKEELELLEDGLNMSLKEFQMIVIIV